MPGAPINLNVVFANTNQRYRVMVDPNAQLADVGTKWLMMAGQTGTLNSFRMTLGQQRLLDPSRTVSAVGLKDGDEVWMAQMAGCAGLETPPDLPDGVLERTIEHHYATARLVMYLGAVIVLLGVLLIGTGVGGNISWNVKLESLQSSLGGATAGVVVCVGGILLMLVGVWRSSVSIGSRRTPLVKPRRRPSKD